MNSSSVLCRNCQQLQMVCPECLGNPTGACGFGEYGRTINDANVAGVSKLYKNGSGCGACYKVRCKAPECSQDGVIVVVTDYGEGHGTDFILSARAYGRLALPNAAVQLFAYGVVDVEYKRVPCHTLAETQRWRSMRRAYGAVWDCANPPKGALTFRMQVSGSAGVKWLQMNNVVASEWKAGLVYDTAIQLT
ncbi:unnamed protein product [Thlaspi arvense]|uniref:Expansin-like B1 n=1 Tax=Thlaspi arvense TaxID=13288 RepID=A0AAU9RIW1_THLAR|nr:unnamed protein product [Thlaspi arvense]